MEYLASWPQIFFLRCENAMCAPFNGITRFWTDKPATRCPHCGLGQLRADPEPFRLLDLPYGTPVTLILE